MHREQIKWGNHNLILETGKIARQADGSVLVSYGETSILCTVVAKKDPSSEIDFFPLTVHYQERAYAAGKIPGGFFKRESRPNERETLISRLIDRPIRPSFPDNFFNEVQIVCTLLSYGSEGNSDILAIIGASAALSISGIPFPNPLAAIRVGYIEEKFIINPDDDLIANSSLDLVIAGNKDGILMVESEAEELSEEEMLNAITFCHKQIQPVITAINNLAKAVNNPKWEIHPIISTKEQVIINDSFEKNIKNKLEEAYSEVEKTKRVKKIEEIKKQAISELSHEALDEKMILHQFKLLEQQLVRAKIIKTNKRIDGRDFNTIRNINSEIDFLPRSHGSALFTRGETQALVSTTLGTTEDEQIIDYIQEERREHFLLHYNFPSYSVGEVGRLGAPGRREIGHGKLAWKALKPLLPEHEKFPYTIRIVSEITESNGSSSMATVCGASLSIMDAGVPIKRPVAGIAMGLIKEKEQYIILSDILGDEDHLGDMDFKVTRTTNGITALQMDIKISTITKEIMKDALEQAKEGILKIINIMNETIPAPKSSISELAPKIFTLQIPKNKIRDVIGSGGKNIRELCEKTNTKIDIKEDGKVNISGINAEGVDSAIKHIKEITSEPEIGKIYSGKVIKSFDFGIIVSFLGQSSGLVHISQLNKDNLDSLSKPGTKVYVKVIGFDKNEKIKLSMKNLNQTTGKPF